MAHQLQERYSKLIDAKMRASIVTKENTIFNSKHEGDPKAGTVKIPVRELEVKVTDYDKANGIALEQGSTKYIALPIDKDKAVNELIDGFDAEAVPDGIVAERLDSAGYSLGLQVDKDSIAELEKTNTVMTNVTPLTKSTIYEEFVAARTQLSKNNVPLSNRWAIVSADTYALMLKAPEFINARDLPEDVVANGAIGRIAGFTIYESNNLADTTEFIAGHPDWCHRVEEWQVPVKLVSLEQSGKYIGASAVQGRKVYGLKVSNAKAVVLKRNKAVEAAE